VERRSRRLLEMRTILTTEDVKNIIENIFNGNLKRVDSGETYSNPNSEPIYIKNEDTGETTTSDLAKYLNITFYNWKHRLIEEQDKFSTLDDWINSISFSMDKTYCLCELTNADATASQDIDNSTLYANLTFLVNTNKAKNIDYYVNKIRNSYLGKMQTIQNEFGNKISAFIDIGIPMYEEEPMQTTSSGECLVFTCKVVIDYLIDAYTYENTKVSISFTGDDTYDSNGNITNTTKFLQMPLSRETWQKIFVGTPLPVEQRADLTGYCMNSLSSSTTLSFYDINQELNNYINDLFWSLGSYRIDGLLTAQQDVNVPVYIRVESNNHSYVYKFVLEKLEKVIVNNSFNICSITLRTWGKIIKGV
jgi:hypothetical protein